MISLDQVLLLEQKVESAVAKIQQLEAENDALRNKCAELTNALAAKSELLSSVVTDQNAIESGIRNALARLNAIENSVIKSESSKAEGGQVAPTPTANVVPAQKEEPSVGFSEYIATSMAATATQVEAPKEQVIETPVSNNFAPTFDSMAEVPSYTQIQENEPVIDSEPDFQVKQNQEFAMEDNPDLSNDFDDSEEESSDDLGFDIF